MRGEDVWRLDGGLHALEGGDAGAAALSQGEPAEDRTVGRVRGSGAQQARS